MDRLSRRQLEQYRRLFPAVAAILYDEWDPIGIAPVGPRDEYRSYVPAVIRMLVSGADRSAIAEHLGRVGRSMVGGPIDLQRHLRAADLLLALIPSR